MKVNVEVLVTQLCPTLYDPMDYNLLGSSVHGISQDSVKCFSSTLERTQPMSWASLVAQLVKNLPAMRETWVRAYISGFSERKEKKKHREIGAV